MVSDNNNNMTDKNIVNNNNSVLICHMHCVHQNAKLIIPCKVYRECINCWKDSLRRDIFHAKLAVNKFFGKLKKVEWVLYIDLDEKREAETESCFYCDVDFHHPKSIEKFEDLWQVFNARSRTAKRDDNDDYTSSFDDEVSNESNGFGEKTTCDQLIVMDDASGLAAESTKLASFLTVARKFNYICVYISHIIYPEKTTLRMILS